MTSVTYANGAAPDSALVFVDGIHMVPAIIPRVLAFIAFAKAHGRTVRIAHPYGGYRTFHEQGLLSGTGNAGSTIPVAAAGHSTHGVYAVGRVDFVGADGYTYDAGLLAWIVAHAGAFGLVREFGTADPNHFMQVGAFTPPVSLTNPEDDMAKPEFYPNGLVYWPNGYFTYYDQGVYNALRYFFIDNPGVELGGTVGTVVREVWAANDYMAQRAASKVPAPTAGQAAPVDLSAIQAQLADIQATLHKPRSGTITIGDAS